MYNGLIQKEEKQVLLTTFLLLTAVPSLVNKFGLCILPTWWIGIYPITYYFIGAYICQYKDEIKISVKRNFVFMASSVILFGIYAYLRSKDTYFVRGDWGDLPNVINSVLVFLFFLRIDTQKIPLAIKNTIVKISEWSFAIYLLSWIADNYVYPILNSKIDWFGNRLIYYFIVVPIIFLFSTIMAIGVEGIYKIIGKSLTLLKLEK